MCMSEYIYVHKLSNMRELKNERLKNPIKE